MSDQRDIIERLMDFDRCGVTPGDRVNLRESAAIEIHRLRTALKDIQAKSVGNPPRHTWYYDRAEEALSAFLSRPKLAS